jgi:hypothetical protein
MERTAAMTAAAVNAALFLQLKAERNSHVQMVKYSGSTRQCAIRRNFPHPSLQLAQHPTKRAPCPARLA